MFLYCCRKVFIEIKVDSSIAIAQRSTEGAEVFSLPCISGVDTSFLHRMQFLVVTTD